MSRPVVVVGSPHDPHVSTVSDRLTEGGVETIIVDGLSFPTSSHITLGERLDAITVDGHEVGTAAAVYVRDVYIHPLSYGVDASAEMDADWHRTLVAFREKAHMLLGLLGRWSSLGIPVYNPRTTEWLQPKPSQIPALQQAGLPVPDTVWTNDPEVVRRFAEGRRVIYKPIAGGAATQELGPEDLTEDRLRKLGGAPVTFQELLEGANFRVYCIDGEAVASFRITSEAIDFRQNEETLDQIELPNDVIAQCVKALDVLGLRWGGIDLRAGSDGALRFLEVNSSPMFLGFDARGGTDILGSLVRALAGHAS